MPQGPIFIDSFDDRTTALVASKYQASGLTNLSIGGSGRTGNCITAYNGSYLQRTMPTKQTYYVGLAVKSGGISAVVKIVGFFDGATEQIRVQANADSTLSVVRGDDTVLETSVQPLSSTAFAYIEFSAMIHNSAGAYTLKMNGLVLATATGVNTRNSANNTIEAVRIGQYNGNNSAVIIDDFYIAADQFYGALKIYALLPSSAGDRSQFSPSAGSNYQCVDEPAPNDNTDYVYSSGTSSEDLYQYQDLTDSAQPYGVQLWTRHERDDVIVRKFTPQCKSVSTDSSFAEVTSSNGTYADDVQWMGIDPATGLQWTVAGINSAQFGIKVTV